MTYYGARELADSIRTVRKNTIRIAEDIPETQYGFRPTPETRSVVMLIERLIGIVPHLTRERQARLAQATR